MKLTRWYLLALAPIAVAGCSGAMMGQLAVLAVTVGIFVGTLSLGRTPPSATEAAATPVLGPHVAPQVAHEGIDKA